MIEYRQVRGRFMWSLLLAVSLLSCERRGDAARNSRRFVSGPITLHHVVAPVPAIAGSLDDATMAVYLVIENSGPADTLLSVVSSISRSAAAHEQMDHGGMKMMMQMNDVVIPASRSLAFAPGGRHIMLVGLRRSVSAGDSVSLTFSFRHAGSVSGIARVVSYAALDSALDRPASRP